MIVTGIEPFYKQNRKSRKINQWKVFTDEEFAFCLYDKEIDRYHIELGREISSALYDTIWNEIVLKGAKQKAMDILIRSDQTEYELMNKLIRNGYREDAAMKAVEYVKAYHYIDDGKYIQNYIQYKKCRKSIYEIKKELSAKGLDQQLIAHYLAKVSEEDAVKAAIDKKTSDVNALSNREKQKLAAYLFRKGFKQEEIRKYVHFDWNDTV